LTIELTLAQELIPIPKLYEGEECGSCRPSSMPLNRRHVSTSLARRLLCRTYPKDTQLNNLLYSGIRIQVQGVAQPCNLFTQSISLSNIQVASSTDAHPEVDEPG